MEFNMKDLVLETDPILRQVAKEVTFPLSAEDLETLTAMAEFVVRSQNEELDSNGDAWTSSVGLAAPQLGISKQMFVISMPVEKEEDEESTPQFIMVVVNPQIVSQSNHRRSLVEGESCLSVRTKVEGTVPRFEWVRWDGYLVDIETGDVVKKKMTKVSDYLSIVFQHEYDHLHGNLYYDRFEDENGIPAFLVKAIEDAKAKLAEQNGDEAIKLVETKEE